MYTTMASNPAETVNLQIGDIVELVSPSDGNTDGKQFLIQYLDSDVIELLESNGDTISLEINEDGSLMNESITGIAILSRADEKGYAKQNSLLPGQWIDIFFGGDLPTTFTGEITSLEEDQIEIKLAETGDMIYIDFAYKGLPKDLPIEKIVLRDRPDAIQQQQPEVVVESPQEKKDDEPEPEDPQEVPLVEPEPAFKERIKNVILAANQIQFGTVKQVLQHEVEVPAEERRYGIEKQTNDLLAEMLSDIPNNQRTEAVLNNIHRMIERFRQLRSEFSKFDEYGNAQMPDPQGADFKPLVESLKKLDRQLFWIVPVVRNKKKLFDSGSAEDIVDVSLAENRLNETEVVNAFKSGRVPDGENGYSYLMRSMQKYWTPYEDPSQMPNDLVMQEVGTNINSVVDMLEDFYSSVSKNEEIKRKRFLIQRYNLGENTIEAERVKGGGVVVRVKPLTRPDSAVVKSFITMPKQAVDYSRVTLPATDIMTKSNIAKTFMPYWRLLNKGTAVRRKIVDSKDVPLEFDADTYLGAVTEYARAEERDITYDEYLQAMVPKTRVLFDLVKGNIKGRLSLNEIVSYLEPFMVYHKDLSFMQYQDMVEFVTQKITDFRRDYTTDKKAYDILIKGIQSQKRDPSLLDILDSYKDVRKMIVDGYDLEDLPLSSMSNGELLKVIEQADQGRLFNSVVGLLGSQLMVQDGMSSLLDTEGWLEEQTQKNQEKGTTQEKCDTMNLSKKYNAADKLTNDNGVDIFFDKEFDKTYYDVVDEYRVELELAELDKNKQELLKAKLIESTGMSPSAAEREAEAMLLGKRPVKDGDYAVLVEGEEGEKNYRYFKRRAMQWEEDLSVKDKFGESNKMFCDLEKACLSIDDKCESLPTAMVDIQKDTIERMANEFDKRLQANAATITERISASADNAGERLPALLALQRQMQLRYDIIKYNIGQDAKEVIVEESPYSPVISAILSQGDFVKRQSDISRFVSMFTRPATSEEEDKWWLYCIASGVKLLPTFVATLADAFIKGDDYMAVMGRIVAEQGTESGDGEAIIDKYSSWVITRIDFSTEEGFTDDGFAVQTRAALEADIGLAVGQQQGEALKTFGTPEAEKIYRVMNAVSKYMGLDTESLQEFVISETSKLLGKSLPAKADYEAAVAMSKKKKKPDSYEIVYDQTLILMTLSFLLIGIQTSVPPLRTRKTYPGCVRSFAGYPSQGDVDKSGIEYIACVANGIKSSVEPWNSIKKLGVSKLVSKMESYIDKFIKPTDMMAERIRVRAEYEMMNPTEVIPDDLSIYSLSNFLPPLKPVKVGAVTPVSKEFREGLLTDVRQGSPAQHDKINALRSKIIYISLAIQEAVQKVVHKNVVDKQAILSNSAREPFMENACCNDSSDATFDYFANREKSIVPDNEMVRDIRSALDDLGRMAKAPILFDPEDTRQIYPKIPAEFDKETIYRAFIVYCKYNSEIPISEELRAICMEKPDNFDVNASIQEHIRMLERDGRNYDNESLAQLMNVINRGNIVHLDLRRIIYSNIQRMRSIITEMDEQESTFIPQVFREKLANVLDSYPYENSKEGQDDPVRDLKNYLATSNQQMTAVLSDFAKRNLGAAKTRTFIQCLEQLTYLVEDEKHPELHTFRTVDFTHNAIQQITRVFPNIVINQVKYTDIPIPKHWGLSDRHTQDLQDFVAKHYAPLTEFYGQEDVRNALQLYQNDSDGLERLCWSTMYMTPRMDDGEEIMPVFDERLTKLLLRFYLLSSLIEIMRLTDRDELFTAPAERPSNPMLQPLQEVDVMMLGDVALEEVMSGEKKVLSEKLASLIGAFSKLSCNDQAAISYNYDTLKDKVTRAKEREKDIIVEKLTAMTDEERAIDKEFRNHKIGVWGIGQQKGFRVYEGDTYDAEREAMEKQAIAERRAGKENDVTAALMDVFVMDIEAGDEAARDIEAQELDMGHIGEDNDDYDPYGEERQDEYEY